MTPRVDMVWLGNEDTAEENARIILESGYSVSQSPREIWRRF
jgi:CBS domain containing-hemolysin-like protein